MQSLKSLLPTSLARQGIAKQVSIAMVLAYAADALASLLQDETRTLAHPLHIRRGVMTVRCSHPAVAQEIVLHEAELIAGILKRFPGLSIKSVHTIC